MPGNSGLRGNIPGIITDWMMGKYLRKTFMPLNHPVIKVFDVRFLHNCPNVFSGAYHLNISPNPVVKHYQKIALFDWFKGKPNTIPDPLLPGGLPH